MQKRSKMIIRNLRKEDYCIINRLGGLLHNNYSYKEEIFKSCLLCEEDNKVVGFITYMKIYERAEIIDILMDPSYRSKGYGYKLLKCAMGDMKNSGCHNVTLEVNCNNKTAISLYEKIGFKTIAIRKKYYGNEDGYLMENDLRVIK